MQISRYHKCLLVLTLLALTLSFLFPPWIATATSKGYSASIHQYGSILCPPSFIKPVPLAPRVDVGRLACQALAILLAGACLWVLGIPVRGKN